MNKNSSNEYEPMIQKKLKKAKQSRLSSYEELFVGKKGLLAFLKYELIISLFSISNALSFIF